MSKKLLVTGISGFLGSHLAKNHPKSWQIIGTYAHNASQFPGVECLQLDLEKQDSVIDLIQVSKPDAVFHFAALSNANYCEQNPAASYNINVAASKLLAKTCHSLSIPFLFTSTDLIFDGQYAPYKETDIPQPVNVYGRHKLEAERSILNIYPTAIIARLPLLYGLVPERKNFFEQWIETLKKGAMINAFSDEYRSIADADSVIEGLFLLMDSSAKGIWHLGGKERISRYDFAMKMAAAFQLPTTQINETLQSNIDLVAARPADVSLDSSRAFALGYNPSMLEDALAAIRLR